MAVPPVLAAATSELWELIQSPAVDFGERLFLDLVEAALDGWTLEEVDRCLDERITAENEAWERSKQAAVFGVCDWEEKWRGGEPCQLERAG